MIDIRGKLVASTCGGRLTEIDGIRHLIVVTAEQSATGADLTISQADLDSLIRSKAAMYTILETLTATVGVHLNDLGTFFVAGTFGCFINPRSAITLGMLPDLPLDRYVPLGNSSLQGAAMVLDGRKCVRRDRPHPRPHHLPRAQRQPGLHEPLQRRQVHTPHGCWPVSVGLNVLTS